MKTGVEIIAAERQRQIDVKGWTAEHDDKEHRIGQLATAAACYAAVPGLAVYKRENDTHFVEMWPLDQERDKRRYHGFLSRLAIAGALIAAEIDKFIREMGPKHPEVAAIATESTDSAKRVLALAEAHRDLFPSSAVEYTVMDNFILWAQTKHE